MKRNEQHSIGKLSILCNEYTSTVHYRELIITQLKRHMIKFKFKFINYKNFCIKSHYRLH